MLTDLLRAIVLRLPRRLVDIALCLDNLVVRLQKSNPTRAPSTSMTPEVNGHINGTNGVIHLSARRVAFVSGAARGIGQAIALRLAADGFDVAVNDIKANTGSLDEVARLIEETGQ